MNHNGLEYAISPGLGEQGLRRGPPPVGSATGSPQQRTEMDNEFAPVYKQVDMVVARGHDQHQRCDVSPPEPPAAQTTRAIPLSSNINIQR